MNQMTTNDYTREMSDPVYRDDRAVTNRVTPYSLLALRNGLHLTETTILHGFAPPLTFR